MIKPIVIIVKFIHGTVLFLLKLLFQRNRQYFYGRYFGSDNFIVLCVKNILRPKRFFKKIMYGQIIPLPSVLSLATPVSGMLELLPKWNEYIEILNQDGIVFIPGYLEINANNLLERYELNPETFLPRDKYYRFSLDLNDPDVFKFATEPMLLSILAKFYGCQPYLRHYPGINCTHLGNEKKLEVAGFNDFWHYDTVNQMTAHVLLSDINVSDSCMFYAKGSHRTHREYLSNSDYYYSEKYMIDNFEIIPCVGKSGTLVIFDPNGLHRVDLKPYTFRSHLHLNFVPGNDFLKVKDVKKTKFSAHSESKMAGLSILQRNSLQYITNSENKVS